MKYSVILLSLLGLLLAGCGHTTTPTDQTDMEAAAEIMDEVMEDEMEDVEEDDDTEAMEDGDNGSQEVAGASTSYTAYTEGVIGNGQGAVLFFHATWCPFCIKNDMRLKDFYDEGEYPISTYKIDYDTATDLKSRFGVVKQDTFVKIDGAGNVITVTSFPSEDKLRELISN